MVDFEIEVNIYRQHAPRAVTSLASSVTFKSPEYIDAKKDAERFAELFAPEGSTVDFFVSYNIYDVDGRRKASTTLYEQNLH